MNDSPTSSPTNSATNPPAGWRVWEPWFQGWMVLAPLVGLGSTALVRNQLFRIWKLTHGITDGVTAAEARDMGLAPPDWSGAALYGLATLCIFSVFYLLAARTWVNHSNQRT